MLEEGCLPPPFPIILTETEDKYSSQPFVLQSKSQTIPRYMQMLLFTSKTSQIRFSHDGLSEPSDFQVVLDVELERK